MNIEEYIKTHKGSTNVTWALFVRDNIKKGDYARLNMGEIVKVIGIKENKVNKKAIYFEPYDEYNWCDSMAVESFSEHIIDLIEVGDYVNEYKVAGVSDNGGTTEKEIMIEIPYEETYNQHSLNEEIRNIVTKEQFNSVMYKVGDIEC